MSKSGRTHYYQQKGKQTVLLKKGLAQYGDLGKNAAKVLIGMRLSGRTKEECDAWMEEICQEFERIEKEMKNAE